VEPYLSLFANPYLEKVQASALTYDDIKDRRASATRDGLDEHTKEKRIFYRRGGNNIAYYMDAESAKYRVDLAREYGIAGVAYWRMGGEDLNAYNLITK
jgi:spore germination protein YaaH